VHDNQPGQLFEISLHGFSRPLGFIGKSKGGLVGFGHHGELLGFNRFEKN